MYHVWSCRTPSGAVAPTDGWSGGTENTCSSGGRLGVKAGTEAPGFAGNAELLWRPAANVRAVSASIWRSATARSGRSWSTQPVGGQATAGFGKSIKYDVGIVDSPGREGISADDMSGISIGTASEPRAAANHVAIDELATSYQDSVAPLWVSAGCWNWQNDYFCSTEYWLYAADLRLQDLVAPDTGTASGGLVAAMRPEQPAQAGTLSFSVAASDQGSGLMRAVVEVDGKAAGSAWAAPGSPTCSPAASSDGLRAYLVQVPCPGSATLSDTWDSRTVSNGVHDVRLLVEDASGRTTVAAAGKVRVANPVATTPTTPTTPVGPGTPEEQRGESNGTLAAGGSTPAGSPAGDSAKLTLLWPATARAASAKPAEVKRCRRATYAAKHPLSCRGREPQAALTRSWSSKAAEILRVRLTTPSGNPIVGARVSLSAQVSSVGVAPAGLPPVVTDANGVAEISVLRAEGSRRFTANWFARAADSIPASSASATLAVDAATSFSAPRRVGRSANVRFAGRLRGPAGLLGDVPLTLEVFNQGRWKPFDTATSGADGRWSKKLQFAPRPGIYPVRVRIGKSPTFPFTPGVAASVRVRVS